VRTIRVSVHDSLWMRRWTAQGHEALHSGDLMEGLVSLRGSAAAAELVRRVRVDRLLSDGEADATVRDLLDAVGAGPVGEDPPVARSSAYAACLAGGEDPRAHLAEFNGAVTDELGRLLEDLSRDEERPVA
jgi:hypothetical protein